MPGSVERASSHRAFANVDDDVDVDASSDVDVVDEEVCRFVLNFYDDVD